LKTCADFFKNAKDSVKSAYAQLFAELLDPMGAVKFSIFLSFFFFFLFLFSKIVFLLFKLTDEASVNIPAWSKAIDPIYVKAMKMSGKPKYTTVALPLITNLLCVSKKEFFLEHWFSIINTCFNHLKVLI